MSKKTRSQKELEIKAEAMKNQVRDLFISMRNKWNVDEALIILKSAGQVITNELQNENNQKKLVDMELKI